MFSRIYIYTLHIQMVELFLSYCYYGKERSLDCLPPPHDTLSGINEAPEEAARLINLILE